MASVPNNADTVSVAACRIVLSLDNCCLPSDKLIPTPSSQDGLDAESETDLRILGCEYIQMSGILLRLPQVAMATGQVLFQRYYYSKSLVRYPMEITAMACVTLASKIEEAPRRIRDVINVFHHMKQVRQNFEPTPMILDENYISLKNQVIKAERRLLKELGFCVHVKHPHKMIVTLLQVLDNEKNQRLMQCSWNYMNDSLRTNVFVRYSPETIACACIYLSARLLQVPLPDSPPWFEVFGVSENEIRDVCTCFLNLYSREKPDQEKLEKIIEGLRKEHEAAKLKLKGLISDGNTPNSTNVVDASPGSKTNSPTTIKLKQDSSPTKSLQLNDNSKNSPSKRKRSASPNNKRSRSKSSSPYVRHNAVDKNSNYEREVDTNSRNNNHRNNYRDRDHHHHHHHRHHKHKRSDYSRSRSKSPSSYRRRHTNNHYSSDSDKKARKRSKSPHDRSYKFRSRHSSPRDNYVRR